MDEFWTLPEEGAEGYIENESTGDVLGTSEGIYNSLPLFENLPPLTN